MRLGRKKKVLTKKAISAKQNYIRLKMFKFWYIKETFSDL